MTYRKIGILVVCKRKSVYSISYYQMQKKGSSVDVCFYQEDMDTFDKIDTQSKKYPTILCVQGTGLVQRMMTGSYEDIKQNIPNINTDEYLVELDENNREEKLVALCRKELIEAILNEESLKAIPVHNVTIGFVGISRYLQLFSNETSRFEFEGNTIRMSENRILEIQKKSTVDTEGYLFAGKKRKAVEILALSAGLTYFTGKAWNTFQIRDINGQIKEYTASRLSSFILYYLGSALFVLLLVNFLMFDYYDTKRNEFEIDSQGIATMKNELNQLQADLNVKRKFIQQNNVPANFAFAFYADRLASYVSDGIELSELSVCPVINKVKEDKVILFQSNVLRVVGTAPNSAAFSTFLEKINKSAWVKKLDKQVYAYNKENDNADFEIEIQLNHAID